MMIAPLGVSIRATTVPVTPGTLTFPSAGSDLSCSSSRTSAIGASASAAACIESRSIFSIRSHSRRPVPRSASVWPTWFCVQSTGTRFVWSS